MRLLSTTRLLALAGSLAIAGATLSGCTASQRPGDSFASGGERTPTPRTLHMMAKLINENGRSDQAEYILGRIIQSTPGYLPAYVELADLYIGLSRFEDARGVLELAHEIAPNDAVIANNLGVLYLRDGFFQQASEAFTAAVTNDAAEARYHANLAVSFAMQGDYDSAFSAWATVLPPEEVFWNLAVVAEARGDQAQAGEYFAYANDIRKGIDPFTEETVAVAAPSGTREQTATVSVPVE